MKEGGKDVQAMGGGADDSRSAVAFHPAAEAAVAVERAPRPRTTGTRWGGTRATGV